MCVLALGVFASPALADSGSISGTVTSGVTGKPLRGIDVEVVGSTGPQWVTTDASGDYTVTDLPSGSQYQVNFSASQYYAAQTYDGPSSTPGNCTPQQCYFVTVSSGQTTSGIDAAMQMDPHWTLTGTVTNAATGSPVQRVQVVLLTPSGGGTSYSAVSDVNGTYAFSAPAGTYLVDFGYGNSNYVTQYYKGTYSRSAATPVAVTAGQLTSGIDAAMGPPATVSGTVTDAATGAPAAGIRVVVGTPLTTQGSGDFGGQATTDASGHYSAPVSSSGTFVVWFSDPSGRLATQFYGGLIPSSATRLSITTSGQALTANEALGLGGSISGTVTVAGTNDPPSFFDNGRDEVQVTAYYSSDGTPVPNPLTAVGGVGNDGTYKISGLAAGVPLKLEFTSLSTAPSGGFGPAPYADAWYCEAGSFSAGSAVTVSAAATTSGINDAVWRPGARAPACGQSTPSPAQIGQALSKSLGVSGSAGSIAAILKHGGYAASITAPGAGTQKLVWYYVPSGAHLARATKPTLIASGSKTFAAAGSATLELRLTAKGHALLKGSKRLKLTAIGAFAPKHGKSLSKRLTFVIKR